MTPHPELKGKILSGFGDSLVDGHYNGIGMLHHVAAANEMIYHNYAINGASVIPCKPYVLPDMSKTVYDIAAQIKQAPDIFCDFVCFDGLTNDAYEKNSNYPGIIADSFNGNYDTSTFCGAFENICYLLRKKYQNSAILYICPHKMPTRSITAQNILQENARKICEKWSIPYVDMYRKGQINTCIDCMRINFSYNKINETINGNGTHLNESGYRLWYAPVIESALIHYSHTS